MSDTDVVESSATVVETPAEASQDVAESVQVAPETPPAAPVDDGPLGPRFSALAKREKEITIRERAAKEAAAKREAEIAERLAKADAYEAKRKAFTEDPLALLEELGVTYQELTERVLKHGEPLTAEDRVAKLEAKLAAEEKAREEAAVKAAEDAKTSSAKRVEESINAFKSSIKDFVAASADTYEMIALEDAHELVFDVVEAKYQEDGTVMSVEKAAELVEAHLLETALARFRKSKKLSATLAPAPLPPPPLAPVAPAKAPSAKPAPTLTNKLAAAEPTAAPEKKPLLTAREIAEKYNRERRARNARA